MKANSPRYAGVVHCDGAYKLTVIDHNYERQEFLLVSKSERKIAEDFLLAAMDLAAVERITHMGNTAQPDMFRSDN